MRLLVCGSRTFANRGLVEEVLTGIYTVHSVGWQIDHDEPLFLCHGDAAGADTAADDWAIEGAPGPFVWSASVRAPSDLTGFEHCPIVLQRFPADWEGPCDPEFCTPGHRRWRRYSPLTYCPAAGPRRNRRMLEEFEPTRVLAFVDKPLLQSKGTADMVELAAHTGVEYQVVADRAR